MAVMDKKRGYDFIGISASFVVHDGNGRILLQKRGLKARDEQGNWDIGGGAIEFGETIEETVRREIREELGCDVFDMEFLTVYDAHREHEGRKTHWVAIIYAVKVDPRAVVNNEPHKIAELGWFTSKNLPHPRHSQFDKSVPLAIERGIIQ
jgi:8-oxo-dGTP diphosphatase